MLINSNRMKRNNCPVLVPVS